MTIGRNSGFARMLALAGPSALALFAVLALGRAPSAMAAPCPHAEDGITEATAKQHARAIECLIGKDRAQHDRDALSANGKLREAASRHNRTMIKKDCFAHDCPGEPGLGKRIKDTGYLDGARSWSYGESFGCATSPKAMLILWLNGDFHRGNIRSRTFRDMGSAAAHRQVGESDCDGGDEITFTVVFAQRRG